MTQLISFLSSLFAFHHKSFFSLDSPLAQYTTALTDVALVRLIRQVAQCYACVQFSRLLELAATDDLFHLERLLVDCVRHNDMQIRVDHANK